MSEPYKSKLQILLESFDKKYIEEIFDELQKEANIPPEQRGNVLYNYNGYRYILRRIDLRMIPMSQGGFKIG